MTPAVGGQRITGKYAGVMFVKNNYILYIYYNNNMINNDMISLIVDVSLQNNTIVMLDS